MVKTGYRYKGNYILTVRLSSAHMLALDRVRHRLQTMVTDSRVVTRSEVIRYLLDECTYEDAGQKE